MTIKEMVQAAIILILLGGSLTLAVIDEQYRPTFMDMAKIGLGGYLGLSLPKSQEK
ncbi:MAG: hypothetical protein F6K55_00735 [Moorea sp. SIO4A3]|nr:hypothetical protein [Moorena sp. SIO4A3]